jgi:hypothetical protein
LVGAARRLGAFVCAVALAGCASNQSRTSSQSTVAPTVAVPEVAASTLVSITTLAEDAQRVYLEALQQDARFEARNGCLYVGDDQTVWFFGTTVRPKPGSTEFEIFDAEGRKLAETGTTVYWGGGQVSSSEAAKYGFVEKLSISPECAQRAVNFWLVGAIGAPKFESSN